MCMSGLFVSAEYVGRFEGYDAMMGRGKCEDNKKGLVRDLLLVKRVIGDVH